MFRGGGINLRELNWTSFDCYAAPEKVLQIILKINCWAKHICHNHHSAEIPVIRLAEQKFQSSDFPSRNSSHLTCRAEIPVI